MADNKKYYYLKLKDNFFDSDEMIVLESMPDGYIYSNILLKLYLRSLKYEGRLMFNERIPFNSTMLSQVTRHSVGDVEKAIQVFRDLELIEVLDNGAIYMLDIQNFIGKSSTEADRKRDYRQQIKKEKDSLLLNDVTNVTTNVRTNVQKKGNKCPDKSTPEIEIELEKEIEIEKEREGETGHPAPAAYGRYNNVILTDTELSGLKTELPDKWEYYIDRLSCHIASTGKQYHSHAATIYKWAQEDAAKGKATPKQGIPDYSCKEGESL